jgi:hypothetical protein
LQRFARVLSGVLALRPGRASRPPLEVNLKALVRAVRRLKPLETDGFNLEGSLLRAMRRLQQVDLSADDVIVARILSLRLLLAAALLVPLSAASHTPTAASTSIPVGYHSSVSTQKLAPLSGALLGAFVNPDNAWRGNDDSFAKVRAFESLIGRTLDIDLHYYAWDNVFPSGLEQWDIAGGRIPLITWYGTKLDDINSGASDVLIRARAAGVRKLGAPVFIRWGWEMNGDWYPHSGAQNMPDGPTKFIEAWRRIHRLFDEAGATNAVWVWSPNFESKPKAAWNNWLNYYPGDKFVDWVGIDAYNWGTSQRWSGWRSLADLVKPIYTRFAARKPIMIAETASAEVGGSKARWIHDAAQAISRDLPAVKALVWFDVDKETDWRVDSSAPALAAFRELAQDPYFRAAG